MWLGTQAAATVAMVGAALVVAGLHGSAPRSGGATAATYRPPAVALPETAHAPVQVAPVRAAARVRVAPAPSHARGRRPGRRDAVTSRTRPTRSSSIAGAPATRPAQSFGSALASAVGRIPTYRPGAARWVVSTAYDFWGTADWYHDVLYVNPDVPRDRLYDVAVHEWSHELSVLDYGGDVAAATHAMNAWFGGSDLTGAERAADCMAILQGATWTHYTTCASSHWRAGAQRLVSGQRL